MTISKQEVDQMASFMRALSTPASSPSPIVLTETNAVTTSETPSATEEMKTILERFYAAAGNAADIVTKESDHNAELREAMMVEKTPKGSRIGYWEIDVREEGKRQFYNVRKAESTIASDLLLYEAAHGLVRILNGGGRINSPDAINLLRLEQDYASALNDAVLYKHYLVKNPNDRRVGVFEARYSAAKHRAIHARDQISTLTQKF